MSYRSTVLADAAAGFWPLADVSLTVASDLAGTLHGTYTGSPVRTTGPFSTEAIATLFDGVDDLVDVPDSALVDATGDFSIECWFKTGTLADANVKLFWKRLAGNGYALHVTTATGLLTFECETGAVNSQLNTTVTSYADGLWHHVVCTRAGANGSIYVDGVLKAGPTAMTAASLANTAVLRIGSNDTVTRRFVGTIFGPAFYNVALTATQIAVHYAARLLGAYTDLIASTAPTFVVLAEVQPMEVLGAWTALGGATPNVYSCAFALQVQTDVVAGGLGRELSSVRQNDVPLTLRTSIALVNSNLGSYYHSGATLYVSTTTGVSPDTFALLGAWFTLRFSTASIHFTDQPAYLPLLTGEFPTLTSERPDPVFGATITSAGAVTLLNGDALFDRLTKRWVWRNKTVTIKLGGQTLAYADFRTVVTMRINGIAVSDDTCTLQLEDMGNILNRTVPVATWGDGAFVFTFDDLNPGASGLPAPILFGTVADCPLVLTTPGAFAGLYDYRTVSPIVHPSGIRVYQAVYAIEKATGARTQLTFGAGWTTYDLGRIITTYTTDPALFDVRADLAEGLTVGTTNTLGGVVRFLLEALGVTVAQMNVAAFAAVDTGPLYGWFQNMAMPAADLMRLFEQSALAQVYLGTDGLWTIRLFDPSTADWTLTDTDFVSWEPTSDLTSVLNEVRVQCARNPSTEDWDEVSASADATRYANETTDSHGLQTALLNTSDARVIAHHLRFLRSLPAMTIAFEERGLTLMEAQVGDLVAVTRARGPIARTGRLDGQLFILTRLEKSVGPDAPVVRGVLSDMEGQADRISRCVGAGVDRLWSASTAAQQAVDGFMADANGYLDATDPITRDLKVMW